MAEQLPLSIQFQDAPTLADFLSGANAQALSLVQAMAEGRGETLLYLCGEAGSGKSHLLQGAAARAVECGVIAAYLPLGALLDHSPEALSGLDGLDLVLLDEIDAIVGIRAWEEALFHLFNRLRSAGGRMIAAARLHPGNLGLGLPDLVSRLSWGLVLELRPLDDAQKEILLLREAGRLGMPLDAAAARYLLRRLSRDPAALMTFLRRLDRASLAAKHRPTIPFIKKLLATEAEED